MNETIVAQSEIDVTTEICPMTYVRVRLALDRLAPNSILCVKVLGAEAARNIPASATAQGHVILSQQIDHAGVTHVMIQRKA